MVADSERDRAKGYFSDPDRYVRNNPYIELRADAVRRLLPRFTRKSILDLGCGDGRISIPLVGDSDELMLVDSSASMLDLARANVPPKMANQVRYICADLAEFEPPRTYDIVLCIGVLAHVYDPSATLRQVARSVAPNGCAIIQLTGSAYFLGRATQWLYALKRRLIDSSAHTLNNLTLRYVCTELLAAGLKFSSSYRYVSVPGVRRLPPAATRAVVRAANHGSLSSWGGEVLALFTR
jgi:2-polyprenyl-3-methyl-5-hydroxy-6-metoxy-1,4-benzoquinol methylase